MAKPIKSKMKFAIFLCCFIIDLANTTTISEEDLAPILNKWENEILKKWETRMEKKLKPIREKLGSCNLGTMQLMSDVQDVKEKIDDIVSGVF